MLQKCCTCSQALRASFIPPTEGLRDYPLIQSKISPPTEFNKQTTYNSDKLKKKNTTHRSSVEATFSDFPFPAGRHPKGPVYALHHNRQAASKELSAPLTFTHPSLIALHCSFWGEGTKGMSSIQLFEWARSVARNTMQRVSW